MSGTVYTVASGKGGVGKTTTSVNLAVALWQEGNAVALVDADIGMANLAAVLNLEPEATLHDVLSGRATVDEALVEAQGGNLLVLPGDRSLESFADADPRRLRAAVDELAERCDYVIVDTGAGLSYEDVLPLGMAHGVLLVTTPDPAAFGDTRKTMEVADLLGAPIRGLVVTRAVEDTDSEAIAGEIGAELLGTVPEDPAVMASTVAGNPLESHAPDSEAAAAYRDVAATLLAGDEEWLEAHPREPIEPPIEDVGVAAEPEETPAEAETPAPGDPTADDETPREAERPVDGESPADDDAADAGEEAGEAWAAANEEPVDADDAADFGDIMVEPGESREAEEPEDASADEEAAGGTDGGPAAREEGGTAPDEAEASADAGAADDRATDETAPPDEPDEPWAASAADLEAEVERDSGGSTTSSDESDDAGAADDGVDEARDGTDEEAPDEGPGGSADQETADPADRATEEPADDESDEVGAGDEEVEPGEEDGAAEDRVDEAADPGEAEGAGESDEETADADEEEEAEEEGRGGFFGWLGRLF